MVIPNRCNREKVRSLGCVTINIMNIGARKGLSVDDPDSVILAILSTIAVVWRGYS